jgi:hypothetical protein
MQSIRTSRAPQAASRPGWCIGRASTEGHRRRRRVLGRRRAPRGSRWRIHDPARSYCARKAGTRSPRTIRRPLRSGISRTSDIARDVCQCRFVYSRSVIRTQPSEAITRRKPRPGDDRAALGSMALRTRGRGGCPPESGRHERKQRRRPRRLSDRGGGRGGRGRSSGRSGRRRARTRATAASGRSAAAAA